ncbi:hypothetical protein [Acinetobacter baumannii]|uniref:hypothetical protein n=1 Tax=Acinetobacter baumannii TaxID=470 RepID=UPI001F28C8AC|nr:hypothetical protein [Acinetobacter baumannii]MDO7394666.1 hypothetical protein [Acinetobacter baumannii]UJX48817.1 hypothetical protein HUF98_03590 [Acinetobacter baumannii]
MKPEQFISEFNVENELSELGCTCVQINGVAPSSEDRNYKFCPFCVECFEEMAVADDYDHESIYGGGDE